MDAVTFSALASILAAVFAVGLLCLVAIGVMVWLIRDLWRAL